MIKINPDLTAAAAMLVAIVLEIAVEISSDESLLAQIPPPLVAAVFVVAALARYRAEKKSRGVPKPIDPSEALTPIIDLKEKD